MSQNTKYAPISWAQANTTIFITICLQNTDIKRKEITIKENYLEYSIDTKEASYQAKINLWGTFEQKSVVIDSKGRFIEITFQSTEKTLWPRLTKETNKHHWLTINWHKWADNDVQIDKDRLDEIAEPLHNKLTADLIENLVKGKNTNFIYLFCFLYLRKTLFFCFKIKKRDTQEL
jgi:hypothetical protein